MDPAECINILSRASAAHGPGCNCKPDMLGGLDELVCLPAEEPDQEQPGLVVDAVFPPIAAQQLETGTALQNSSSPDGTASQKQVSLETILDMFPHLRPASDEEGEGERFADLPVQADALVLEVIRLHGIRVLVHKAYDAAFKHLFEQDESSGGTELISSLYPVIVKCVTARFKAASDRVRHIASSLDAYQGVPEAETREVRGLIRKLQQLEQGRLRLVAQHHFHQSQLLLQVDRDPVQASCNQLRQQLGKAAQEIEETVSELRYSVEDLREAMAEAA
mmetsp:Transcript_21670/g.50663  ORF Transcript_21670/g.50663 Transcript_21670/m.50663 type:complete len:278 (+) Transcript_21670:85-918(+)